jgi:hypothetical protein
MSRQREIWVLSEDFELVKQFVKVFVKNPNEPSGTTISVLLGLIDLPIDGNNPPVKLFGISSKNFRSFKDAWLSLRGNIIGFVYLHRHSNQIEAFEKFVNVLVKREAGSLPIALFFSRNVSGKEGSIRNNTNSLSNSDDAFPEQGFQRILHSKGCTNYSLSTISGDISEAVNFLKSVSR